MHRLYERYVGYAMAVALRYVPMRDGISAFIIGETIYINGKSRSIYGKME